MAAALWPSGAPEIHVTVAATRLSNASEERRLHGDFSFWFGFDLYSAINRQQTAAEALNTNGVVFHTAGSRGPWDLRIWSARVLALCILH